MLKKIIKDKNVVITDGSMGTYLEILGYKGKTPELALTECPDLIKRVHTDYIEAGANIILTDTFGANKLRLDKKGLAEKIIYFNTKAVEIASEARGTQEVAIAGDIGPTGAFLQPYGELTQREAGDIFLQQAEILKEAGADFILLETFQDLEELKTAFHSIKEKIDVFVLPSITIASGDNLKTLMGQSLEDIARFVESEQLEVIGINCGISSKEMVKAVKRLKSFTDADLWIKPNAGQPHLVDGDIIYPENSEEFVGNCLEMVRNGVKFIGGCCGTTPQYINLLKAGIDENS